MNKVKVSFVLNGKPCLFEVDPNRTLLAVLREDFNLTGTKSGCNVGECGACTVLINNEPANSCLVLAPQVEGASVTTIEGLGNGTQLDPLQAAFMEKGAVQCGFCTPGMIMSAKALLLKNLHPTEEEIRKAISGNLCRCTGYQQIVEAIQAVQDAGSGGENI